MKIYDVIVIGGGASGLVAAIEAGKQFDNVALLEKENRTGKKILATGNGKCNLTNKNASVKDYSGSLCYGAKRLFGEYSPRYIVEYFENMGLVTYADELGRVYPKCNQSSAVLDTLRNNLRLNDIDEFTDKKVTDIAFGGNFRVVTNDGEFFSKRIIIACGGKSSPNLGSDGSMFQVIEKLGHSFSEIAPALCPINVKSDIIKSLKGVRSKGMVSVLNKGKVVKSDLGEIQFTENSISGICAFNLSGLNYDTVRVSLLPDMSNNEIINMLKNRREILKDLTVDNFLLSIFNNKLSAVLLKKSNINSINRRCADISNKEIEDLAHNINNLDFKATGKNDFGRSQVTKGGIPANEINIETMESLYIPNLYFCGEVLDIDGICGGYNLQFAFASGIKAGQTL
ncbi:MAG: aminoacetone oxidase family FAD-binding enzyme [Oscillospiraceae bacterium]|nr:aminoacetone oxidase family FAD-binding enzyme [Oscillospiraceae bacterium]